MVQYPHSSLLILVVHFKQLLQKGVSVMAFLHVACNHLPQWKNLWHALIALFLTASIVSHAFAASSPAQHPARAEHKSSEQTFNAAKAYAQRLERESILGKDRDNWVGAARTFRKIFTAEKKGPLGPSSLYLTAKTFQRMFERFKQPQDLENARRTFLELADLYPGHTLADDALFAAAQCAQQQSGQQQLAADLYKKIITLYPAGDQAAKAQKFIGGTDTQKVEIPIKETATQLPGKNSPQLFPAKYWSSPDYCRIVLQAPAPLLFTKGTVAKTSDQVTQLSFEIAKSRVAISPQQSQTVSQGLLKRITSQQVNEETVRVSIDVESLTDYAIFSLTDPFRVVVDVRGEKTSSLPNNSSAVAENTNGPPRDTVPSPQQQQVADRQAEAAATIVSLTDQKKRTPVPETPPESQGASREKLSLAQQLGLGVRKIVIDPGHGGKDPGAMAFGLKEKDIVLKISKKVAALLKEKSRYEVVLTRNRDVFLPLEERTAIANANKSDLFISIHTNAHSDRSKSGIETYFLNLATDAGAMRVAAFENATSTHNIGELQDILTTLMKKSKIDESTRLARFVHTNLVTGFGQHYKPRDLGVKQAPFYVLLGAQMPAVLAEISFITNPEEAKLLQNEGHLNKIAAQLAAGIAAYVDHHHTAALKY